MENDIGGSILYHIFGGEEVYVLFLLSRACQREETERGGSVHVVSACVVGVRGGLGNARRQTHTTDDGRRTEVACVRNAV